MSLRWTLIALAATPLIGCTGGPMPSSGVGPDPAAARGQAFAARRCAGCHTIGMDDGGATEGPRFRDLSMRYNALSLQKRFSDVSQHGSGMMPPITFTAGEAQDLVAYFGTLHP